MTGDPLDRAEDDGLEHPVGLDLDELSNLGDARHSGCVDFGEFAAGRTVECTADNGSFADLTFLHVGRVARDRALQDGVLPARRVDHELVARGTADGSAFGFNRREIEPAAREDVGVRAVHRVVDLVEPPCSFDGGVEGIGILHDELAAAEQSRARTGFIAVLGLDLVEAEGELLVRSDRALDEFCDGLFVRGAERGDRALSVRHLEEQVAVVDIAFGVFVKLDGEHRGEQQLACAGGIHFLADDLTDLAESAPGQGQVVVDAGAELADESRAGKQDVRGAFGIGRSLAGGRNECGTPAVDDAAAGLLCTFVLEIRHRAGV